MHLILCGVVKHVDHAVGRWNVIKSLYYYTSHMKSTTYRVVLQLSPGQVPQRQASNGRS
jgi:hypothetical protein